jgi:3-methylcrotonyl-CoA carboxylase alpha subunit
MRAFQKSSRLSRHLVAANAARHSSSVAPVAKPLTSVLIANRGEIAL